MLRGWQKIGFGLAVAVSAMLSAGEAQALIGTVQADGWMTNLCSMSVTNSASVTENRSYFVSDSWVGGFGNWDDHIKYTGSINSGSALVSGTAGPSSCGAGGASAGSVPSLFFSGFGDTDTYWFNLEAQQKRTADVNYFWGNVQYGYSTNTCAAGQMTSGNTCQPVAGTINASPTSCVAPCSTVVTWSTSLGMATDVRKNGASWNTAPQSSVTDTNLPAGTYVYALYIQDGFGSYVQRGSVTVVVSPGLSVVCLPSSQTVQTGASASFSASGPSGPYSWSAPSGSPASGTGALFSTQYSSTGSFTVTVSDGTSSGTCSVTVISGGDPVICSPATQTVVTNATANFSVSGGTSPYTWTAPGGSPAGPVTSGSTNFATQYATTGSKTVTVSDGVGSSSCSVTVNPPAGAGISISANPSNVNSGDSSTISWTIFNQNTWPCTKSGGWSGSILQSQASGSQSSGPLFGNTTFRIDCPSGAGTIWAQTTVTVGGGGGDPPPGWQITLTAATDGRYECIQYDQNGECVASGWVGTWQDPLTGNAPLNNVDLLAQAGGTMLNWGNRVDFDCTNDGTIDRQVLISTNPPDFTTTVGVQDLCNYSSAGTYTAKAEFWCTISCGFAGPNKVSEDTVQIIVTPPPPPTPPGSFTLQPIGSGSSTSCSGTNSRINLSWTASSGATSYEVYRDGALRANAGAATSYIDSVSPAVTYSYYIRALNLGGGTNSNTQNLTATFCYGDVTVQATLNGNPWSGPLSYSLFGPQGVPPRTSVPFVHNDIVGGMWAVTYSSGGPAGATLVTITPANPQTLPSNVSAEPSLTFSLNFTGQAPPYWPGWPGNPPGSPPPPSPSPPPPLGPNLNVTVGSGVTCGQITLTWNDATGETGYRVWVHPGGGGGPPPLTRVYGSSTYRKQVDLPVDSTSYSYNPSPGTYYYIVTAYNAQGHSPPDDSGANTIGPVVVSVCYPNLGLSSLIIDQVNGTPYTGQVIRNNYIVKFKVILNNSGNAQAFDVYVSDALSANLVYQSGTASLNGSPVSELISGQTITLNATRNLGDKLADANNWLLTFDARVQSSSTQFVDFIQSTATIYYALSDGGAQNNSIVRGTGLMLIRTGQAKIPDIKEVAP